MSRNTRWLIGLAVAGSIMMLLALIVFDWMSSTCRLPSGVSDKPLAEGPIGCFEFWIARYQTFIGAAVALIAAGAAWVGVRRQIDKASRQIEISDAQLAASAAQHLLGRMTNLRKINALIVDALVRINAALEMYYPTLKSIRYIIAKGDYPIDDNDLDLIKIYITRIDRTRTSFVEARRMAYEATEIARNSLIEKQVMKAILTDTTTAAEICRNHLFEIEMCDDFFQHVGSDLEETAANEWMNFVGADIEATENIRMVRGGPELRNAIEKIGDMIDRVICQIETERPV
jgi:hypothetical protein